MMSSFVEVNIHHYSKNLCTYFSFEQFCFDLTKKKLIYLNMIQLSEKYKNVRISIHLRSLKYTLRNKVNKKRKVDTAPLFCKFGVLSPIQIISSHCYTCCVMLSIAAGWYDRYVEFFNNTLPNNQTLLDMWKNHLKLWEENVSLSSTIVYICTICFTIK